MFMKLLNKKAFQDAESIINLADPQPGRSVKVFITVFSMYSMKVFATTRDIQDPIGALNTWRYNVFLNNI